MVSSWTRSSRAVHRKRRPPAPQRARTPERLFVLGRGNLGRSLEQAFRAAGHFTSFVPGRTAIIKPPSFGIVFLAVPDQAVEEVAAKLARLKPTRRLSFVHVLSLIHISEPTRLGMISYAVFCLKKKKKKKNKQTNILTK